MSDESMSEGPPSEGEESNLENNPIVERHMSNDMRYRRALVSFSDQIDDDEYDIAESVLVNNISVNAWEDVVSNPKYIIPVQRKKKESITETEDDGSLTSSRSALQTSRNYELDFVNCPAWKMGVEPMTYRYIPNNGRYRAYKLAKRLDTPKAFKKSFSSSKLSTDQHFLHKEIQRELRREFELFISLERQKSSLIRQQEAKQRQRDLQKDFSGTHKDDRSEYDSASDKYVHRLDKEQKQYLASKAESTASVESVKPPANLPPLNMQHLSKEQGEYYLEQVSSRLKEMQKDIKIKQIVPDRSMGEGYLNGTGFIKQSQSEPGSLTSPRDSKFKAKNSEFQSKHKKLPTINDSDLGQSLDDTFFNSENIKLHRKAGDNVTGHYRVSRSQSQNNYSSVTADETMKANVKRPEAKQRPAYHSSPFVYDSADPTQKGHETIYSESPLHNIAKNAERGAHKSKSKPVQVPGHTRPPHSSGHVKLFSEYKLRRGSDNPFNEPDPETVTLLDNIRSSITKADDDDASLVARSIHSSSNDYAGHQNTRYTDPRGQNATPQYEDYAKVQVPRNDSGRTQREIEQLHETIVRRDYMSERKKIGVNPYLQKPKASNPSAITENIAIEKGVQLKTKTASSSHTPIRSNIMPEVMVRRAEIASTQKRII